MLDYLITGGTVVDGTGSAPRTSDVGIRDGRVVSIGKADEPAARTVDADGLVVSPGFVDPHTHYDAQLHWDGHATPSQSNHGVTSVIGGNCGFTLAPIRAADADYARRMMAQVEGMPLLALECGIDWNWETFGEFLDGFEGRIGVNAGFLVGHCALRRYVMAEESLDREATAEELATMVSVLQQSLQAGGLGLSTTRSSTHPDHEGNPVASRQATEHELLTLCRVVGQHEGTTLEAIVEGCLRRFSEPEIELLAQMKRNPPTRPMVERVVGGGVGRRPGGTPDAAIEPSSPDRRSSGGFDDAHLCRHQHEPRDLLRPVAHFRLAGDHDSPRFGEDGQAARSRRYGHRCWLQPRGRRSNGDRTSGSYSIGDTVAPENKQYAGAARFRYRQGTRRRLTGAPR